MRCGIIAKFSIPIETADSSATTGSMLRPAAGRKRAEKECYFLVEIAKAADVCYVKGSTRRKYL
jgi:hypothetical protein